MVIRHAFLALALVVAAPVDACRLALVLAIDVSSSVNAGEDRLQRAGLAAALIDADVQAAILAQPEPVAIAAFEWSGQFSQYLLFDWTVLSSANDVLVVADQIAGSTRQRDDLPTAMGAALGYAAVLLTRAPDCWFKTIDLAGDGMNNETYGPRLAYNAFPFEGVTVNGLVVLSTDIAESADVLSYYRREVMRGPAAFVEVAQGFEDYQAAMRRKLLRELTSQMIGASARPKVPAG